MEPNREPRNKPTYLWSIYDKAKNMPSWKDSIFSKWYWENQTATRKQMELEHYLAPHTKFNSKWIIDWNARPKIIELLEEIVGDLLDTGPGDNFFELKP